MALPTLVNQAVSTWLRPDAVNASFTQTALVVNLPAPSLSTATCNLTSDTLIFRADGGLWDDTQSCWIPIDKVTSTLFGIADTPRK